LRSFWIARGCVVVPMLLIGTIVGLRKARVVATLPAASPAFAVAAPQPQLPAQAVNQSPQPAGTEPRARELSPDRLFARVSPAVVQVMTLDARLRPLSQGSGFFVTADGLLVTNYHVIEGAGSAKVLVAGGAELAVEGAVAVNASADLALLKVSARGMPFLRLADDALPAIGAKVYAVGSPEGLTNTLSEGLVSGVRTLQRGGARIQTSAPISHGSSGGPLLGADGAVLGVTCASIVSGQNLNLAIPASEVATLIRAQSALVPLGVAAADSIGANDSQEFHAIWSAIHSRHFGEAIDRLARIAERQKTNAEYWYAAGYVNARVGLFADAVPMFREAIRLKPNPNYYLELGRALDGKGDSREALKVFGAGERMYPGMPGFYLGAGIAWMNLGDNAHAIKSLARAAEMDPTSGAAHRMAGRAYYNMGQTGAALDALDKALKIDPTDVDALVFAGDAHRKARELEAAKSSYLQAIVLAPDNAPAYMGLGWAYHDLHDPQHAAAAWRNAATLDPKGQIGAAARKNLIDLVREMGWQ
jgi:tetratricopeptide (TPR) repeat protein